MCRKTPSQPLIIPSSIEDFADQKRPKEEFSYARVQIMQTNEQPGDAASSRNMSPALLASSRERQLSFQHKKSSEQPLSAKNASNQGSHRSGRSHNSRQKSHTDLAVT